MQLTNACSGSSTVFSAATTPSTTIRQRSSPGPGFRAAMLRNGVRPAGTDSLNDAYPVVVA